MKTINLKKITIATAAAIGLGTAAMLLLTTSISQLLSKLLQAKLSFHKMQPLKSSKQNLKRLRLNQLV